MPKNPFLRVRWHKSNKTVQDTIDDLVEAFSADGSADILGAFILEMAAKKANERLPKRREELDALLARIEASKTTSPQI